MVFGGYKKPTNRIVVAGNPLVQELKIETVANCYPGRLVKRGSTDFDIVVNTVNGSAIGWLGYEQGHEKYKPLTVDTIYVVEDWAPVLGGGNFVLVASIPDSQTIIKGDRLVAAAIGQVAKATAITASNPSGSTTVLATSADPTQDMAGGLAAENIIVAIAEEAKTTSGSISDIMVRSLL
jgi:hypothetical protein